jgi:cation:H+ antiporter
MELLTKLILVVFLLIFFYLLGKSANLIVINLKRLGNKLGLPMYFLGLILGLFTSLPEFIVGINSLLNGIENVAFGNLFGGTLVALALVLGINAVMNKSIKTNTHGGNFMVIMAYILLPILLSLDGMIGIVDGSILIVIYLLILYKLYSSSKNNEETQQKHHNKKKLYLGIFWIVFGITGVVVLSTLIVNTTELLLVETGISQFALGLILFAIGTNLPEITIAIKSMQNHNKELSYSNILGSAAANPFLIGVLSFMQPLRFQIEIPYMLMAFFTFMLVIILYFFYKSDNKFTRKEGIILIWIYILFVFSELLSQIYIGGH